MILTLIPFFVATHLTANDTAWPLGPEYVFQSTLSADFNFSNNVSLNNTDLKLTNQFQIICRPKSQDVLSCQFLPPSENATDSIFSEPVTTEIQFDRSGIKNYVIKKTIENQKEQILKMTTSELNVGVDLTKKKEQFEEMEKSLMGECMTEYTVTKTYIIDKISEKKACDKEYELVSVLNQNFNQNVIVKKCRNLSDCSYYKPLIFSSFSNETIDNITLLNYCTEISISDKFMINTNIDGTLKSGDKDIDLSEKFLIELVEVRPATKKIEQFNDTKISSIYAFPNE